MKLKEIIGKLKQRMQPVMEASTEKSGMTQEPMTTEPCNTVQKPKRKYTRRQIGTKPTVKNKRNKMVYDEDLDKEIKRAQTRLYYLQARKKTGKPTSSGKYVSRKRKTGADKFKEVPVKPQDFFWYQREVKDTNFVVKFVNLRKNFRESASIFGEYMLKLDEVLRKYGTEAEWAKFQECLHLSSPLSVDEEQALEEVTK